MVTKFMTLVLWGHEHGCEIEPLQREEGWFFSQPGSSVACSLVEHEAIPKHVGVLDIRMNEEQIPEYQMRKVPLKTVRPFYMLPDVQLSKHLPPDLPEGEKQEHVFRFLTEQIAQILADYESDRAAYKPDVLPLIRLKVEHTDFPAINIERLGAQFVGKVGSHLGFFCVCLTQFP